MTIYDSHLYTFLTKPENFEPFVDLKEQYDKVRQQLVNEFWILVLEEVNKLKTAGMPWEFSLDEPNTANRKLRARHPEISGKSFKAGIIYEHLDTWVLLGAWFDRTIFGDTIMNSIMEDAKKFTEDLPTWYPGNPGWYCMVHKRPGLNLTQKASLLQVLPDVRTSMAKSYAEQFLAAVEQLGSFCLEQAKKR